MQAVLRRQKTSLSVSRQTKERVIQRKRGNQTYDDVLVSLLDITDVNELGLADGIVFLHSIPINNNMKKLKQPIPLLLHLDKNRKFNLANTEYKILVSFCDTLDEAIQDAGLQFAENLADFTDQSTPMTKSAKEFGEKLLSAVSIE